MKIFQSQDTSARRVIEACALAEKVPVPDEAQNDFLRNEARDARLKIGEALSAEERNVWDAAGLIADFYFVCHTAFWVVTECNERIGKLSAAKSALHMAIAAQRAMETPKSLEETPTGTAHTASEGGA